MRDRDHSTPEADYAMGDGERYVPTAAAREAVKGHETEVLHAIGIDWRGGKGHITCPYPDHGGADDWRWDDKKSKAFCTCIGRRQGEGKSHSIFDVVVNATGCDFDAAKLSVVKMLGHSDIIKTKNVSGSDRRFQATDASSLLSVSAEKRDDRLPITYLACRLKVSEDAVPIPNTRMIGIKALAYFDPPANGQGKPKHVGDFPCAVFETVAADGRTHAHRIYLAPGGVDKASVSKPKKSAKVIGDQSMDGCAVLWGDPATAPYLIVTEGIETGAAEALTHWPEIQAGTVAVVAAISANGIKAFKPWPVTQRITVAADRDEMWMGSKRPSRAGEQAARELGMALYKQIEIRIALPGEPATKTDWLNVLLDDGVDAVRAGIEASERFVPTEEELAEMETRRNQAAELVNIIMTYPLSIMETTRLRYSHVANGSVWLQKYDGINRETQEEQWMPVATPIGVPALLRYADQADAYGLRVLVQDMKGRPRPVDLERSALARMGAADIKAKLFEAGLRVEQDGDHIAVAVLKAAHPDHEIVVVSRPGWHRLKGFDPIFVAPNGAVFGLPGGHSLELSVNSRLVEPVVAGTLAGWRKAVEAAVTVQGCQHWIIGVIAAFAGPILSLVGLDTCGINLSGMSSGGKTTAQRLAVSAWSSPRVGDGLLQSMRTTENAVEALAQRSSGTVLALDEMAHADGKVISRLIYSIAGGVGKARMTAAATLKGQYSWATFAVISGECSLEDKVRQDGGQWMAGMAVRIPDIDVTAVNRAVDQVTRDFIDGVRTNYGHAGPAFVRMMVEAGMHRDPDRLREQVNTAAREVAGDGADSARLRAAAPFGLLLVAGELAKVFGLLPASTEVKKAVTWAWARFEASSDAIALNPEEQAIANIRVWVLERWDVSVKSTDAGSGLFGGNRGNGREAVAWYDDKAVYLPVKRLREAAGLVLKEEEIRKALVARDLVERHDAKRVAKRTVPKVGKIDCYALKREEFGRNEKSEESTAPRLRVVSDD